VNGGIRSGGLVRIKWGLSLKFNEFGFVEKRLNCDYGY
jgi:hypothetical protein